MRSSESPDKSSIATANPPAGVFSQSITVVTLGLLTRMSCLNSRSALASGAADATTSAATIL